MSNPTAKDKSEIVDYSGLAIKASQFMDASGNVINSTQGDNIAALGGTLTGTVDGDLADIADIALDTSDTYADADVNDAVNTAIASANLQIKEIQTKVNAIITALETAGVLADS
jgi:hypothetical protein